MIGLRLDEVLPIINSAAPSRSDNIKMTKVVPLTGVKEDATEDPCFTFCLSPHRNETLEEAKAFQEESEERRDKEMENIILNQELPIPAYVGLYGLGGTILGLFAVIGGFTIIKTHDVLVYPEYWYECLFQVN